MVDVHVGGITFESAPSDLDECFLIDPGGLSGWDDGVDVRREELARPVSDGAFDASGYLGTRLVTVVGHLLASSPARLREMRDRLKGVLAGDARGVFAVDDEDGSRWARVRRAGKPKVTVPTGDATDAEFEVSFWAPDPFIYGELRSFTLTHGVGVPVFHMGNEFALPVVEVAGPQASGYSVSLGGRDVVIGQALSSGQSHRIDMRTGWLYRNGVLQTGVVTVAEVFRIPPGAASSVVFTRGSGAAAGAVTLKVHDTYL